MRECVRAWGLEPKRREVLEKDISSQTSDEVVFIPGLSDDSSRRNRREEDHELVPERQILTSYEAQLGGIWARPRTEQAATAYPAYSV